MPQIIVTAGDADAPGRATVTLRERVNTSDFESERFTTNLLERLGWAVEDATASETSESASAGAGPQHSPAPFPEPAGVA